MVKVPPVPSSFAGTCLVAGVAALGFLLLPAELSGSSTVVQHCEVRLPEVLPEVLPVFFFPPGALSAGASASSADAATASR